MISLNQTLIIVVLCNTEMELMEFAVCKINPYDNGQLI